MSQKHLLTTALPTYKGDNVETDNTGVDVFAHLRS